MNAKPPASLRVRGLTHRYPGADRDALTNVEFEIEPGTRLGLLGPNGAGKTTLMRLCCGSLHVQGNGRTRVEVAGFDVTRDSLDVRRRLGYLPEQVPLYRELRVAEHLAFRAKIKDIPRRGRAGEIGRVAELTGLTDVLETPIDRLSRGYRQRVGIADALLGSPALVVLDEPTVGLDPNQVLEARAMLRGLGDGATLVLSSHVLAEVERTCDRVIILDEGRVAADETVVEATREGRVVVTWEGSSEQVEAMLGRLFADRSEADIAVTHERGYVTAVVPAGHDVAAVMDAIGRASAAAGLTVVRLEAARQGLEDRFARVTGAGGRE